jgi:predicted MFS family arabinose efflux permease
MMALARGLGVELNAIYRLVTLRNFAGFFSPLFDPLSARLGHKTVMLLSLLLFSLGCMLIVLWPHYWALGATLILISLAKVIFDPPMQAYVGNVVPYELRGRAFAVTELSWAGALLLGAPIAGALIQFQGWQAPFFWLAILGLAASLLVWRLLPSDGRPLVQSAGLTGTIRTVRRHPIIWGAAAYSILAMGANETFFIVYGDWMESSFNLQLASLGLASGVIGGAEIVGEILAGWSVDRFGKRPVIITAGLFTSLLYLLTPHFSDSLDNVLVTLFILFLFFETTVVGAVPLLSELVPGARGIVMAMVVAFGALGRSVGDILGPWIWQAAGFAGTGLAASIMMVGAIIVLSIWVREARTGNQTAVGPS